REGIVATLTTVDTRVVPEALVGRRWDRALVEAFPEGVDPCGENGEFHSFVSDGPGFSRPIAIEVGEVVRRDPFVYADLFEAQRPCSGGLLRVARAGSPRNPFVARSQEPVRPILIAGNPNSRTAR